MQTIENPKLRVVEDLKIHNQQNIKIIAGEYFDRKFTYAETFKMFDDFKKALIHVDGLNEHAITISAPSTVASVNAFYGTIDANKIANMVGPGFLQVYPEKYTKEMGSQTAIVFDGCSNDDVVVKMQVAGVKNLIITSIRISPPDRSIINNPELQVYIENFGKRSDDKCFVEDRKTVRYDLWLSE